RIGRLLVRGSLVGRGFDRLFLLGLLVLLVMRLPAIIGPGARIHIGEVGAAIKRCMRSIPARRVVISGMRLPGIECLVRTVARWVTCQQTGQLVFDVRLVSGKRSCLKLETRVITDFFGSARLPQLGRAACRVESG